MKSVILFVPVLTLVWYIVGIALSGYQNIDYWSNSTMAFVVVGWIVSLLSLILDVQIHKETHCEKV